MLDKLNESRAVDELDRVLSGELLGRERERAGGDEEAFVAEGVVDCAQEFLESGRADYAALVVLALDDGKESVGTAEAEVGALVSGAADSSCGATVLCGGEAPAGQSPASPATVRAWRIE